MKRLFLKVGLIFAMIMMVSCLTIKKTEAYYGYSGLYGGLYGMYGGYGGLYGGYSGLYGGLYGSYGGLYGGLYGMYGGYGGLYGMYGSGYYGGLYGGLYGATSLYSPFSLQNMYYPVETGTGLTYQIPFMQIAPLLGVAGMYNSLFPNLFNPQQSYTPSVVPTTAPTSSIIIT